MSPSRLVRLRWAVRSALALGIVASVAANVLAAQPHAISRIISAWSPLALLITVELISRVPVRRPWLSAVRITATAAIAGIAAWVSYWHMVAVALAYGESTVSAHLLPASVDGLIVVASICLAELGGRRTGRVEDSRPAVAALPAARPAAPAPSAPVVDEPRPPAPPVRVVETPRPVHVVAASTPARRRTATARVRDNRPTATLGDVLDVLRDTGMDPATASRDAIAAAVRQRGYRLSNQALSAMLPQIRQSVPAAA